MVPGFVAGLLQVDQGDNLSNFGIETSVDAQCNVRGSGAFDKIRNTSDATTVIGNMLDLQVLYTRPGHLARRITQRATRLFLMHCPEVTPRQFGALLILEKAEDLDQKRLAELLYVDQTNIAMIIRGLEKKGLVQRRTAPSDRRRRVVSLTSRGRSTMKSIKRKARRVDEELLQPLNQRERRQLISLLEKLVD